LVVAGDTQTEKEKEKEDEEGELGGLFRVLKKKAEEGKAEKYSANHTDCSCFPVEAPHDWTVEKVNF
jgi:hypothetical protein